MTVMTKRKEIVDRFSHIAHGEDLEPEVFPQLVNFSSAFIFSLLPYPEEREQPEYVYLDLPIWKIRQSEADADLLVKIHRWNHAWETGQLRYDVFGRELPEPICNTV